MFTGVVLRWSYADKRRQIVDAIRQGLLLELIQEFLRMAMPAPSRDDGNSISIHILCVSNQQVKCQVTVVVNVFQAHSLRVPSTTTVSCNNLLRAFAQTVR